MQTEYILTLEDELFFELADRSLSLCKEIGVKELVMKPLSSEKLKIILQEAKFVG